MDTEGDLHADNGVGAPPPAPEWEIGNPTSTLLIRRLGDGDKRWRAPEVAGYRAEGAPEDLIGEQALQKLIAEEPRLVGLPGAAVAREFAVPDTGSLDLLCVDGAGAITLVECKLRDNAEIRRTVVGQVLAYASGLWGLSYEEFERRFDATKQKSGRLLESAEKAVESESWDEEAFRSAVAKNLRAGRFDLIVAVDEITPALQRTVRYLNEHTISEIRVLALELGYARDGDVEVLVPALYGREVKPAPGMTWNEEKLFAVLSERAPTGVAAARVIYEHAASHGARFTWGRAPLPAVTAVFEVEGRPVRAWTLQTHETPNIAVNFEWMIGTPVEDRLPALAEALGGEVSATRVRLNELEKAGWRRRPGLPLVEVVAFDGAVEAFCRAIDVLLGGHREGSPGPA